MERRDPERAPASLAIVVDEFATLAKEVPDFIDGVVDVAQRGRSLGVHLVLATQRPGGVVSENIRANTNLRVALRVNEAAESADVIGVGDAARIPRDRPGRAYVRTGHGELTEVQTGYVGGVSRRRVDDRSLHVHELRFATGVRQDAAPLPDEETDLRRLVAAAAACAVERGIERPPSPWLPPLPALVPLADLPASDEPGRRAVVGLLDEPARQLQEPFVVDLEADGSMLVYGASGAGKTTFLRTLALALARDTSPDELHLYGLDFATRGLRLLEALPHCGAVVAGEDEERTARLFSLLRATLERRKALFAERGVFTLSEYRRSACTSSSPPTGAASYRTRSPGSCRRRSSCGWRTPTRRSRSACHRESSERPSFPRAAASSRAASSSRSRSPARTPPARRRRRRSPCWQSASGASTATGGCRRSSRYRSTSTAPGCRRRAGRSRPCWGSATRRSSRAPSTSRSATSSSPARTAADARRLSPRSSSRSAAPTPRSSCT
jgi:DNA segregation ATPase FtsK/SpoIIIE-like protein